MRRLHDLSYSLGGAVFANAIPHLVSGLSARVLGPLHGGNRPGVSPPS
jgi:hypothetical protein